MIVSAVRQNARMPTHATAIDAPDRVHVPGRFELWLDKQPKSTPAAEYRGRHRGCPAFENTWADPAPVA
jgi:hypothetical protein